MQVHFYIFIAVYRNAVGFSVLILYPTTLLSFSVNSFRFSMQTFVSSENRDSVILPF